MQVFASLGYTVSSRWLHTPVLLLWVCHLASRRPCCCQRIFDFLPKLALLINWTQLGELGATVDCDKHICPLKQSIGNWDTPSPFPFSTRCLFALLFGVWYMSVVQLHLLPSILSIFYLPALPACFLFLCLLLIKICLQAIICMFQCESVSAHKNLKVSFLFLSVYYFFLHPMRLP